MIESVLQVLSWVCLMAGCCFAVTGGIGLVRLPDFFSRTHAGGITDTMGAGLILDDRLYTGAKGGAGEIGHATVDLDGRLCECGRRGCAEAYLSGPSHTRRFEEITGRRLPLQQIFKLYREGDRDAEALFEESLRIMGEIFADMINVLDLEAIILGGGVSNLPIWYDRLESRILPSLFGVPRKGIPIIPARMGDSAGVLGAAYLALRYLGLMSF